MPVNDIHDSLFIIFTSIKFFVFVQNRRNIKQYPQKLVTLAHLMTSEHRTYNTAPSAPIATVASAVRALVVKINNTSARRWRALISRWGSAQARLAPVTYRLPAGIIDSLSKSRGCAGGLVIIMSERRG